MVSHTTYIWLCTALTGGVSGAWLVVDAIRLRRAIRDRADAPASRHDRIFGSVIGLTVAAIGVAGTIAYHV